MRLIVFGLPRQVRGAKIVRKRVASVDRQFSVNIASSCDISDCISISVFRGVFRNGVIDNRIGSGSTRTSVAHSASRCEIGGRWNIGATWLIIVVLFVVYHG